MLLALDTSTRLAGVALYSGKDGLVSEYSWHSANRHTVELMPRVAQMIAQAGMASTDLEAVAVALGPGSFTGLRVALAAAKGLALTNHLALLGVPTLDAVAYPYYLQSLPVIAVVQAGRGLVCWAAYQHNPAGWAADAPIGLATIPALAATISRPTLIAGELAAGDREQLADLSGRQAVLLPPALSIRRPGCLAEIGWNRYASGDWDDPASLSPIYLHEPAL
jgi:tRNA threonylcarbamoyladenosine biosynthesis protein TsaB